MNVGDGGGFAAPAASDFANSGKVTKAPFRGFAPKNPGLRPTSLRRILAPCPASGLCRGYSAPGDG